MADKWGHLKLHAPKRPGNTCPDIDSLIADLERLRADNAALRENGTYWYETAERLHEELTEAIDRIDELETELARAD